MNGNPLGVGYGSNRIDIDVPKLSPAVAIIIMTAVCAGVAAIIGAGALRVRGLLLAVVTFVFALAAQQYLFQRTAFVTFVWNTLWVGVLVVLITLLLGLPAAYALARLDRAVGRR